MLMKNAPSWEPRCESYDWVGIEQIRHPDLTLSFNTRILADLASVLRPCDPSAVDSIGVI